MGKDVASLAAEMMPYMSAAVGAYGGVTQQVWAGRDAYTARRDQTAVHCRQPGDD